MFLYLLVIAKIQKQKTCYSSEKEECFLSHNCLEFLTNLYTYTLDFLDETYIVVGEHVLEDQASESDSESFLLPNLPALLVVSRSKDFKIIISQ